MSEPLKLVVAGAGLIGQKHIRIVQQLCKKFTLEAIVDPVAEGKQLADSLGVGYYPSLQDMFASIKPDGVILATPNQVHVENGLTCIAQKCPILIEKPIADSSLEAKKLIDAASAVRVPLLVGHHRRHNPIICKAKELINDGALGTIKSVHGACWLKKPDDYFSMEWRSQKGAGPIMVNAIHDMDLLRFLCGDVVTVQAMVSNSVRGFENEDTAVVLLKFDSGALGTMNISDTITSPTSWELSSGENSDFAVTQESCYWIGGTEGSLSLPDIRLWKHENQGHWKQPMNSVCFQLPNMEPLLAQLNNFAAVIRGEEKAVVNGKDALKALEIVEAAKESATTNGLPIHLT